MSKGDIETIAIGIGAYLVMSWILSIYPAFVAGMWCWDCLVNQGVDDTNATMVGFIFFLICYGVLKLVAGQDNRDDAVFGITIIYAIFLWPFISIIYWSYCSQEYGHVLYGTTFPGINWIPIF